MRVKYSQQFAEISLVNAMANGIKPVQFAGQSGKSVPTVQSQRQSIFRKVAVNNQLELMTVLRDLTTSLKNKKYVKKGGDGLYSIAFTFHFWRVTPLEIL